MKPFLKNSKKSSKSLFKSGTLCKKTLVNYACCLVLGHLFFILFKAVFFKATKVESLLPQDHQELSLMAKVHLKSDHSSFVPATLYEVNSKAKWSIYLMPQESQGFSQSNETIIALPQNKLNQVLPIGKKVFEVYPRGFEISPAPRKIHEVIF